MEPNGVGNNRSVVPRWRPLGETPSYELTVKPHGKRKPAVRAVTRFKDSLDESTSKLFIAASELESDLIDGPSSSTVKAAIYIISRTSEATAELRGMAQRIVDRATPVADKFLDEGASGIRDKIYLQIRNFKRKLAEYPRDALTSLELGRLYTVVGQPGRAKQFVERAAILCPNDRYVLRSCASFFSHTDRPDIAYDIIKQSELASVDSWVQAAELSVSVQLGKIPRWAEHEIKRFHKLVHTRVNASELAAGLGSVELNNGSIRRARRLFERSMDAPTENALAQLRWTQTTGDLKNVANNREFNIPQSYEAQAYAFYAREEPAGIVDAASKWLEYDPMSGHAAMLGSAYATISLRQYDRAVDIADRGLLSSPDNLMLINNKIVALAKGGHIDQAKALLPSISRFKSDERAAFYYAASGLIAFVEGDEIGGRELYALAMNASRDCSNFERSLYAIIFWLEQEVDYTNFDTSYVLSARDKLATIIDRHGVGRPALKMAWRSVSARIDQRIEVMRSDEPLLVHDNLQLTNAIEDIAPELGLLL
ncbi:hypothetical protein [Mesorhizobium sp. M0029]|uniref:tetratricopeptide repeat protein n=1 Tax=Mesorhizobium sp. M0029 TaxID=2956850 RepID=UPI0033389DBD